MTMEETSPDRHRVSRSRSRSRGRQRRPKLRRRVAPAGPPAAPVVGSLPGRRELVRRKLAEALQRPVAGSVDAQALAGAPPAGLEASLAALDVRCLWLATAGLDMAGVVAMRAVSRNCLAWAEAALTVYEPADLASEIERQLHCQLDDRAYTRQARSVVFNLKDPQNCLLRFKLLSGFFLANEIPWLTAEHMASDSRTAERARVRRECLDDAIFEGGVKYCKMCKGRRTTYHIVPGTHGPEGQLMLHVTCLACLTEWDFVCRSLPKSVRVFSMSMAKRG